MNEETNNALIHFPAKWTPTRRNTEATSACCLAGWGDDRDRLTKTLGEGLRRGDQTRFPKSRGISEFWK